MIELAKSQIQSVRLAALGALWCYLEYSKSKGGREEHEEERRTEGSKGQRRAGEYSHSIKVMYK